MEKSPVHGSPTLNFFASRRLVQLLDVRCRELGVRRRRYIERLAALEHRTHFLTDRLGDPVPAWYLDALELPVKVETRIALALSRAMKQRARDLRLDSVADYWRRAIYHEALRKLLSGP